VSDFSALVSVEVSDIKHTIHAYHEIAKQMDELACEIVAA
jgi:hypothetical protein